MKHGQMHDAGPAGTVTLSSDAFSATSQVRAGRPGRIRGGPRKGRGGRLWRGLRSLVNGPVLFAVCVMIVPALAIEARNGVVAAVPAIAPVYAAIGLPVNLDGLDIRDITTVSRRENGEARLTVSGQIVNLRDHPVEMPDLRLSLRARTGAEIFSWRAPAPHRQVESGASIRFQTHLDAPPDGAADIVIRFARDAGG